MLSVLALLALTAPVLAEGLPSLADLRPDYASLGLKPKNQNPRGCCSLFAMVGVLEFELAKSTGQPVSLSEEFMNWASHQTSGRGSDGSFFSDALRGVECFGICTEALMPYAREFNPDAVPSLEAFRNAEARKDVSALWIKEWDVTTGMTDAMLAQIRESVASGHPVAIGMRWPKTDSYLGDQLLSPPKPEDVFDGHSVVIVAYEDDAAQPGGGTFIFRNSFGPDWGEAGHSRMSYAYAQAYGNDALGLRIGGGRPVPSNRVVASPIEIESLEVADQRGCHPAEPPIELWCPALWSGKSQVTYAAQEDARLDMRLIVPEAGSYGIRLFATRAPSFGKVRVSLDGKRLGRQIDLFAAELQPSGAIDLGPRVLEAGTHALRFDVIGRNDRSAGFDFGLDCIELERQP